MKILTVQQPYATLLLGPKRLEIRSRPTKYRGLLGIHAGLQANKYGPWDLFARDVALPRGVVIGSVHLVDCRPMTGADEQAAYVGFRKDAWAWVTVEPYVLRTPIPLKGKLGIFNADIRFP